MEEKKNESNSNLPAEARSKVYDLYKKVQGANQVLSSEELEVAIESLKLAQQTMRKKSRVNIKSMKPSVKQELEQVPQATCDRQASQVTQVLQTSQVLQSPQAPQLPDCSWFTEKSFGKTNTYTGSLRKDVTKGSFSTPTFNYKAVTRLEGGEPVNIRVTCFRQLPWRNGLRRKHIAEAEFSCSEKGVTDAIEWLKVEWQKFINDDQYK